MYKLTKIQSFLFMKTANQALTFAPFSILRLISLCFVFHNNGMFLATIMDRKQNIRIELSRVRVLKVYLHWMRNIFLAHRFKEGSHIKLKLNFLHI